MGVIYMMRNLKRLAVALVISGACFLGTVVWFESGKNSATDRAGREPVARLNDSLNDVQRKPTKRVIWESVSRNDELYPGEAIRTAPDAEAKIQLVKSGAVIHLEPDSLVVLEENANGLSLDFLQGNLFVQGGAAGADLTLKTAGGEIKVNSADMSLSRDQSGQVNLEVHKGQAELQKGAQKISLAKDKSASLTEKGVNVDNQRVEVLSPQAGEPVLLNLSRGEKLEVTFKPLPADFQVSAEWGTNRNSFKPTGTPVAGNVGKLLIPGKAGKVFLRLQAKSESADAPKLTSIVIPLEIGPKAPPALIEPSTENPPRKTAANEPTNFRWLNRHKFESQVLEIAADPQFKNVKSKQTFGPEVESFATPLSDGVYFWRVTGFLKVKTKTEALASTPARFTLQANLEVKPPIAVWPLDQQKISFADANKAGVSFKWQSATGVDRYAIEVWQGEKVLLKKDLETTYTKLSELKPGTYQWKIGSWDPKSTMPKFSAPISFVVEEMPKIEWAESPATFEYTTPNPTLTAHWKPLATPPASYRYRVQAAGASEPAEWHSTKLDHFEAPVPADGEYEVFVEALNAKDQTVAQSDPRTFTVKRLPLLPAPQWSANTPEIFKTDAKGNLSFAWEQVEGAKHYLMILETEEGKVVEKKEIARTTASFTRLKPGQYKVSLKSVDGLKRPSTESRTKELVVPSISDIRAPKIKNMKVK